LKVKGKARGHGIGCTTQFGSGTSLSARPFGGNGVRRGKRRSRSNKKTANSKGKETEGDRGRKKSPTYRGTDQCFPNKKVGKMRQSNALRGEGQDVEKMDSWRSGKKGNFNPRDTIALLASGGTPLQGVPLRL